jgi:hypothetical protein
MNCCWEGEVQDGVYFEMGQLKIHAGFCVKIT